MSTSLSSSGLIERSSGISVPANRIERATKWIETAEYVPPPVVAAIKASIWFTEVESFRDQEEEALAQGKYEQTLDEHRAALGLLIGTGERIAFDIKTVGLPPSFSEFGLEDLMVTLNSLHVTFNCQHGTKNPDVLNAGIEKLLNVEESKD